MKLNITKEDLLDALDTVSHIVASSNTLPVLDNVLLESDSKNKDIILTCTNLEIAIRKNVKAEIKKGGSLTLPAKLLYSYISLLKDGESILIEEKEKLTCSLTTSESNTEMKIIDALEFPTVPELTKEAKEFKVPVKEFTEGISRTIFSVSGSNIRPTLAGVYIYSDNGDLIFVSTDIYRLSEYRIKKPKDVKDFNVIIPSRSLQEVFRIFGKEKEDIICYIDKNQVVFEKNGTTIISRLIEGKFPEYKKIIPEGSEVKLNISKSDFTRALKTVSLFAKEQNYNIRLKIDPKEGEVIITSEGSEIGRQVSKIPSKIEGETVEVALNAQYILDFLSVIRDNVVRVEATSKLVAVVFKPEKEDNFIHLIMPLKID